jgi:hypothetical protein
MGDYCWHRVSAQAAYITGSNLAPSKIGKCSIPGVVCLCFHEWTGRERNDPISNSVADLELVLVFDEFWMSEKSFFHGWDRAIVSSEQGVAWDFGFFM